MTWPSSAGTQSKTSCTSVSVSDRPISTLGLWVDVGESRPARGILGDTLPGVRSRPLRVCWLPCPVKPEYSPARTGDADRPHHPRRWFGHGNRTCETKTSLADLACGGCRDTHCAGHCKVFFSGVFVGSERGQAVRRRAALRASGSGTSRGCLMDSSLFLPDSSQLGG